MIGGSANPLTILHLHRMGDPALYRESVSTLEHMIAREAPQSVCFVHDAELPLPEFVREMQFDVIVLGPTFLCARYDDKLLHSVRDSYGFIAHSTACKIALPQDDYDCSEILDQWMVEWNVDFVYTVCPSGWDVLYPEYQLRGALRLGFTGYVSDAWIKQWARPRPYASRINDVVYRASKLPANFGHIGQLKSEIVESFIGALPDKSLATDLSTDPKKMIPGKAWHAFLESSRACLVTPSGSSLLDPRGLFRQRVCDFVRRYPQATFEEIAAACFPGQDGKQMFTAISPRNIEAALSETVQLAVPGDYSGILHPHEHYVPLEADCSNIAEVIKVLRDHEAMQRIALRCKEAILSFDRLRTTVIVEEMLSLAVGVLSKRNHSPPDIAKAKRLCERYAEEIRIVSQRYWARRRLYLRARSFLKRAGLARVRDYLTTSSR